MKKINFITLLSVICLLLSQNTQAQNKAFKYRKYAHVTELYKRLGQPVIDLCVKHKVPPAAVLSMISLESGWGNGYIGNITGNFLSLNTRKGDIRLPALYLPTHLKTKKVVYDEVELKKYADSELNWRQRPSSLKKDYRPANIAGTKTNLGYFNQHPDELTKANLKNVEDFLTIFISSESRISAYRRGRQLIEDAVKKDGIEALFSRQLNIRFMYTIGGRPSSFNHRATWPKKVFAIMRDTGLDDFCKKIYLEKQTFEQAW